MSDSLGDALCWEEVGRAVVYKGHGRALAEVVFDLPSGSRQTFSVRIEDPTVTILALTTHKCVVLTRQFRPGPHRILYEMPGGYMNVNESTLEAAHRELLEETGYCGRLQIVGECYPDAYGQVIKRAAVALDCELVAPQELDVDEFAGVSLVRLTEFRRILRSGQMTDVDMGYMGLDFLGLL